MKQGRLPGVSLRFRTSYGGNDVTGKRKIKRPFDRKKHMHLVFRSASAIGLKSMLNKSSEIEIELWRASSENEILVEQFTNAGNHLHLLIRAPSRQNLQKFLKAFSQKVARLMVGLNKKFWTSLVFSRIVEWGRDLRAVTVYIIRNLLETIGEIPYDRKTPAAKLFLLM